MTRHPRYEILLLIRGELDGSAMKRVERHLRACPVCQRERLMLVANQKNLSRIESVPVPRDLARRTLERVHERAGMILRPVSQWEHAGSVLRAWLRPVPVMGAVAAMAVVVFAGLALWRGYEGDQTRNPVLAGNDVKSLPSEQAQKLCQKVNGAVPHETTKRAINMDRPAVTAERPLPVAVAGHTPEPMPETIPPETLARAVQTTEMMSLPDQGGGSLSYRPSAPSVSSGGRNATDKDRPCQTPTPSDDSGAEKAKTPVTFESGKHSRIRNNIFRPGAGGEAIVAYELSEPAHVLIRIYDMKGVCVRTLVDAEQSAGTFEAVWNGLDRNGLVSSSGVYYVSIRTGLYEETRKVMIVK